MYEHHKLSGMEGELDIDKMFPMKYKIVLNTNNDLIAKLTEKADDEELSGMLAAQVYDMALMNLRQLRLRSFLLSLSVQQSLWKNFCN